MKDEACRIRFVTRKWAPAMGGMETYCVRLAAELAKSHRIEVIALPGRPDGRTPTVARMLTFGVGTVFRLLKSEPAEIVHIGDVASWPLGWVASMRHPDTRVALSAHGSDISYAKKSGILPRLYGAYLRLGSWLLKDAILIANSRWIAELAAEYGFHRTTVVPLATDVTARETSSGHNGSLFFAGRITKRKGLSFFIQSILPHIPNPPEIRVAGAICEPEEAAILANPAVTYLGVLDADRLAEEYSRALCVIVPSIEAEGFGLVAAEAAAAGGVVVAAAHSGLLEAISSHTGFVAAPDDPDQWARIISEIREWQPSQRARFVARCKRKAAAQFGWDRLAGDTVLAYGRAIGRKTS